MAANENVNKLSAGEVRRLRLPTSRKSQFFDIIKTQFNNLVKIELLVLLLCLPMLALLVYFFIRDAAVSQYFNYTGGLLIGYPGTADSIVDGQLAAINDTFFKFIYLVPAITLCGPALAGMFYCLRNYVWGDFGLIRSNFWKGIRLGWKQTTLLAFIDSVILLVCVWNITYFQRMELLGTLNFWAWFAFISSILLLIVTAAVTIVALPTISMYDIKFFKLIKNSFFLGMAAFFRTIIILVITALPFVVAALFSTLSGLMYLLLIFIGIVMLGLLWTVYAQYLMDTFFASKERNAAYGKGIYQKPAEVKTVANDAESGVAETAKAKKPTGVNKYTNPKKKKVNTVVTPLGENYSRKDLERLSEQKKRMDEEDDKDE